ncbi:hypothetical protein TNCV_4757391 [Trichonephila clavipes]|nr:hypothetical protein TNCV_4757391 [Trichonephila clavipes]
MALCGSLPQINLGVQEAVGVSNFLGTGKPTSSPFDLFSKESHRPSLDFQTIVSGKCPSSPEDEKEKQGECGVR